MFVRNERMLSRHFLMTPPSHSVTYAYSPSTGKLTSVASTDGVDVALAYDGRLRMSSTWTGHVAGTHSGGRE